jgi:large subunit ribosomal protein L30
MADNLKITLIKSMIGRPEKHRRVLRGLGLNKMHGSVVRPNLPEIRGMVGAVSHLIKVEEVSDEAS